MKPKKPKLKKCDICKTPFEQKSSLHTVCSMNCAIRLDALKKARKARQERAEVKKAIKELQGVREWIKEAQKPFNRFIRIRDYDKPCISCGRYDHEIEYSPFGKWDCGHFLSVGSHPELRFNVFNAHKQCKSCNGGSGNYAKKNYQVSISYEANLIERIGQEKVDWLKGPHEAKHYTVEYLERLKKVFSKKARMLEKRINND